MKLVLLICLSVSLSSVSAQNKDYQTLYNKYKQVFASKATTKGTVTFASVGDDPVNCDFDNIQDAINTGIDEVRIQRFLTYTENITIQNQAIKLIGGYESCFGANNGETPIGTNASIIDGNDLAPVININNDTNPYEIILKNIELQNGNSGMTFFGGGLEAKGTATSINISNFKSTNNTGSGINVESISQLNIKDALLSNNTALIGGGIACSDTFVVVYGRSAISSNSATIAGGGIYAYNQCNFSYFSGKNHIQAGIGGMIGNTTDGQGAGIYAYDGATINLNGTELDLGGGTILGDSTIAVKITSNIADSDGGGLFISGANTQANLTGIDFQFNRTPNGNGGGIAVFDQATLVITRYDLPCWDDIKCNSFYFNRSSTAVTKGGGGVYAEANSTSAIGNAYFEKNTATFGTAIWLTGGAQATVEGSVFTDNNASLGRTGNYVIGAETASNLTLGFNTFVDNLSGISIIAAYDSTLTNVGNLFYEYEMASILAQSSSTVTNNCIVSRNTTGLVGINITQAIADPFVDRVNLDFHLDGNTGMVAVDLCNTSVYNPSLKDMDQQPRGFELPIGNVAGPYDVGADEIFIEEIFSNGFE